MARQRNVYPTSEIPHLWAHQTQASARNPQGSLFFEGRTIYSYRTSWPLAALRPHKKRPALVLTNCERCSVTTAQHQSAVNLAVSHLTAIAVPSPALNDHRSAGDQHGGNIAHLFKRAADYLTKAQRAMTHSTVAWRRREAMQALADARTYCAHFGIRRKIPDFPAAEWDAALARAQAIENPDPVRDAKRLKARERRQAAARKGLEHIFNSYCAEVEAFNAAYAAANLPTSAEHWRATGQWQSRLTDLRAPYLPWKMRRKVSELFTLPEVANDRPRDTLLRVNGDQIETSRGARIPLDHAPRIWALVQACRNTGRAYTRNGHTEHAGQYAIDAVDTDGTLRAGCHSIKYAELELMARTLGYVVAP